VSVARRNVSSRASVLQQERGGYGRVPSVGVENSSMFGGGQKNFSRLPAGIIKETNTRRVCEAAMLEIEHQVGTPVGQSVSFWSAVH
jgi:hypothetical protein